MIGPIDLLALEQTGLHPAGEQTAPDRPLLRYFGGKWRLAPWIISHFPAHRIYVEPFGGAASVLLRKERSYSEVVNDLDGEIVHLFRVLQDRAQCDELHRRLRFTLFARDEFELAYQATEDPVERARRLLVRAWMGYGSQAVFGKSTAFRTNVTNQSNPAGDWMKLVDTLPQIVERLRGVTVEHRPAVDVIAGHDTAETLFYVDPPYPHGTRSRTDKRYRHEMSDDDHRALAAVLHSVAGMVVLSGYACSLYDQELYPDWTRFTKRHHAEGARKRVEVLWLNDAAARYVGQQMTLFAGVW